MSRPWPQVKGRGLWVHTAGLADVDAGGAGDGAHGAFFVPLSGGDVVLHGWDVVHGIHLKDGQMRPRPLEWECWEYESIGVQKVQFKEELTQDKYQPRSSENR